MRFVSPDPTGEQLQRLVPLLRTMVASCTKGVSEFGNGPSEKPRVWGIVWECVHRIRTRGPREALAVPFSPPHVALTLAGHTLRIPCSRSFMSLPQRGYTTGYVPDECGPDGKVTKSNDDRTLYQQARFGKGLKAINVCGMASDSNPRAV